MDGRSGATENTVKTASVHSMGASAVRNEAFHVRMISFLLHLQTDSLTLFV